MTAIYDNDKQLSETLWIDKRLKHGAPWQVIYVTVDGLDYCRETYDGVRPLDAICEIADREIANLPILAKAKIEKW